MWITVGWVLLWLLLSSGVLFVVAVIFLTYTELRRGSSVEKSSRLKLAEAKEIWAGATDILQSYFAANQRNGTVVFGFGLYASIVGFALILGAIVWIVSRNTGSKLSDDAKMVAGFAAILGLVAQFVAVTFLAFYRSINSQATVFARTLFEIARIQKGIDLAQHLDPNLSGPTVAAVAVALVRLDQSSSPPAERDTESVKPLFVVKKREVD